MIINHNLTSLNACRNLELNRKISAKTTEKLSSGLRINRAADDAAGSTISETMRSQIRGLYQASRNSQDAISLIQTAEGALSETQTILQRIRELSVQAANDGYTSNDRLEIQKEIDQLIEEVDRIANTTTFNNKNLLDGTSAALVSTDRATTEVFMRDDPNMTELSAAGFYNIDISATKAGIPQTQTSNILLATKGDGPLADLTADPSAQTTPVAATGLDYYNSYAVSTNNNAGTGFTTSTAYEQQAVMTSPNANPNFFTSSDHYQGLITAASSYNGSLLVEVTAVNPAPANTLTATVKGHVMREANGAQYDFTQTNVTLNMNASFPNTIFSVNSPPVSLSILYYGDNHMAAPLGGIDPVHPQYAVGDKTVIEVTASNSTGTYDTLDIQTGYAGNGTLDPYEGYQTPSGRIVNHYVVRDNVLNNKTTTFKFFSLNTDKSSHAYGTVYDGSITLRTGALGTSDPVAAFNFMPLAGQPAVLETQLKDIDKFYDCSGRFLVDNPQTLTIIQGDGSRSRITIFGDDSLQSVIDKINEAVANELGQGKYVSSTDLKRFASYDESTGNISIISAKAGKDGEIHLLGDEPLMKAFGMMVTQASTETQFTVNVTDIGNSSRLIAQDLHVSGNLLQGAIPNADISFDINADTIVTYDAGTGQFVLSGDTLQNSTTFVKLARNSLVFQVGSQELQNIRVAIGDMGSKALGINPILVTDQISAGRSITAVDMATKRVSSQRSALGAVQNRLEHTIQNLDVAGENLTASESRIRDSNMAQETVTLARINILSQTASVMLAHANQQPQQVLELIGGK